MTRREERIPQAARANQGRNNRQSISFISQPSHQTAVVELLHAEREGGSCPKPPNDRLPHPPIRVRDESLSDSDSLDKAHA